MGEGVFLVQVNVDHSHLSDAGWNARHPVATLHTGRKVRVSQEPGEKTKSLSQKIVDQNDRTSADAFAQLHWVPVNSLVVLSSWLALRLARVRREQEYPPYQQTVNRPRIRRSQELPAGGNPRVSVTIGVIIIATPCMNDKRTPARNRMEPTDRRWRMNRTAAIKNRI